MVNRHGHRDDDVALEKAPGVTRILVLGDSFTLGANVRREEAYPRYLEQLLDQGPESLVEVINTGVGGWDPFHYAQYYEHYGDRFDPDLVLVGFFVGNDTYSQARSVDELSTAILGRRVSRDAAGGTFIRLKILLYENLNLARLILNKGPMARDLTREHCEDFSPDHLAIQSSRVYNHFRRSAKSWALATPALEQILRIKRLLDPRAVPLVVVLIPDENQLNAALQRRIVDAAKMDRYDFDMPQSMLVEMLRHAGIPVIDLLPAFRRDARCLYMNDTRWPPA